MQSSPHRSAARRVKVSPSWSALRSTSTTFGCAITVDGAMTCWGSDIYGETSPPEDEGE